MKTQISGQVYIHKYYTSTNIRTHDPCIKLVWCRSSGLAVCQELSDGDIFRFLWSVTTSMGEVEPSK